ncbi:SAM-dependent methyltransferase [Dactylosporangium sp. CS-047395]|uniref:SAM-dependent methyltransferase n=1 Tax=Dactylosporangium sp. CS-047395 TaxID=3239936 RepID=UPI003D9051B1
MEAAVASDWTGRAGTDLAHPARRYDYWLGGKDNYAADRESGDAIAAAFPAIRTAVVENRAFLRRVVRTLAAQYGIRQFLDIGTGIPTSPNVHEVAQEVAPAARVVYVDNDPIVLAHARALLTGAPEGATAYVDADLRDPHRIVADKALKATLDLTRPVALMLVAVVHFLPDDDKPHELVADLLAELAPGSFLVMSHATTEGLDPELAAQIQEGRHGPGRLRDRDEFARFMTGLDLLDPGIVSVAEWRAQDEPRPRPAFEEVAVWGAVGRKAAG